MNRFFADHFRKDIFSLKTTKNTKKNFLKTLWELIWVPGRELRGTSYSDKNLDKNSFFLQKKNQLIINYNFFKQPHEIIFRSFSDSLKAIGMKYYAARGKKIDKVIDDIKRDRLSKATLGGCIIEKINQTVIISKE